MRLDKNNIIEGILELLLSSIYALDNFTLINYEIAFIISNTSNIFIKKDSNRLIIVISRNRTNRIVFARVISIRLEKIRERDIAYIIIFAGRFLTIIL